MTAWSDVARATIERVAATLPDKMTLKARKAAIDAAYPFGPRSHWPYRAWCKARRAYLANFDRNGVKLAHARPSVRLGARALARAAAALCRRRSKPSRAPPFVAAFDAMADVGRQLFVVSFHEGAARGVWMGATAFGPGKRDKPATQASMTSAGFRVGALVYRRK
ncbi:MAG: hypothetical protein ACK4YQ_16895 [Phenylobacterium sp.]|uniref:hypothetical protein n=1 Tax=Phenylobacterium sp. TaxID=1871053 RepID=UPI00391D6DD3